MRDFFFDTETYSPIPLKNGSFVYSEKAEVMLWSYALEDDEVKVWDAVNHSIHWQDELSGVWCSAPLKPGAIPVDLEQGLSSADNLVWGQNSGMFDFPIIDRRLPHIGALIEKHRRRDTMVQAFAHALPGALEKLGSTLNLSASDRKIADGKRLIQLMCKPQSETFKAKWGTDRATKQTHPVEWQRFIEYAGGDIITMRAARRLMPKWNYRDGKQVEMCLLDWKIQQRGFQCDLELAHAAVRAADKEKAELARQTKEATDDAVGSATQRDELLGYILAEYGVDLPDMQADTLERRLEDPDLPDGVKELIRLRLQASRNTASKFKTLLKAVNSDGRLRGWGQFRGAGRTGRRAHRKFQPGNLMRPTMSPTQIELAIRALKTDCADLLFMNVMEAIGNTVRGVIIAAPGKKLVVADLSNIEGRVAAWLAGEEWKLQAFRDYDASLVVDLEGKPILNAKGEREFALPDLYIKSYAASFNVPIESVPKKGDERQIGKVCELMFQFGSGVGGWITGAATYGIDLEQMTEQVWDVLPEWTKDEAKKFLLRLYEKPQARFEKTVKKIDRQLTNGETLWQEAEGALQAAKIKARFGLPEHVFVACDAIKRLWRKAHPKISSYWKELEETVRMAINSPGETFPCRRLKIRRDGAWLRIGLPSGRALCYPNPRIKNGKICYTGYSTYSRQWGDVYTYGAKVLENATQAVAADQLFECQLLIDDDYPIVLDVHDENVTEVPDTPEYTADELARRMCSALGWNKGLPLAAAGAEMYRYAKG